MLDSSTLEPVKVWADKNTRLDLWLKGSPTEYTTYITIDGVPAGKYVWAVGLVDVTRGNEIGLKIAARNNVTTLGWVKLSDVILK